MVPTASAIGPEYISIIHMRKRATFDFHFHNLTNARSNRGVAIMKDQATPTRSLLVRIARMCCTMLLRDGSHSFRMRVVSKVITMPVGVADLAARRDSIAA